MKNKQSFKIIVISAILIIIIVFILNKALNNDNVSLPSFQKINLIDINISNRTDNPKNPFSSLFDFSSAKESVENYYKSENNENKQDEESNNYNNDNDSTSYIETEPTDIGNEELSEIICCDVLYVVDGDTICVSLNGQETRIRLIGINTPESVASDEYLDMIDSENSEEGKEASEYTKSIITDTVYLEFDEQMYDTYGRTLAYVYLDDSLDINNMLNYILYKEGYAELMFIEPNTKYQDEF